MHEESPHPHLLAWYLSGDLDPDQARETEGHLRECADCRAEISALSAMMQTVRQQSRLDAPGDAEREPRALQDEPLARQVPAREPFPRQAEAPRKAAILWIAAATAFVIALPAILAIWSAAPTSSVREVRPTSFPPPLRGGGERTLTAPGPWAIRVVTPIGAPRGAYRVRIERADGARTSRLETAVSTDGDGNLDLLLDSACEPGRYSMILEPADPTGAPRYLYPFEVLPAAGPASTRQD